MADQGKGDEIAGEKKVTFEPQATAGVNMAYGKKVERAVLKWLGTYWVLVLILVVVVVWQTKVFGYYDESRVNARLRAEAEAIVSFGKAVTNVKKEGEGVKIEEGNWVTARITGYRQDGTQFWSTTMDRTRSVTFQTGQPEAGKVIPGLDAPLIGLTVGTAVSLTIPPDLAFGERGKRTWHITPWEVLSFDVVILAVHDTNPNPKEHVPEKKVEKTVDQQEKKQEEEVQETKAQDAKPATQPSDLSNVLSSIGLQTWEGELRKQGLVSVEDFKFLEKEGDLPDTLPLFTRRKLVAHAKKLRAEGQPEKGQGQGQGQDTCDAETCTA